MIIGSAKGGVTLPNENNSTVGLGAAGNGVFFEDDYTDASLWTQDGTEINVNDDYSNAVGGTAITSNASIQRVYRALPGDLSDELWYMDMKQNYISSTTYATLFSINLTGGTNETYGTIDLIGVYLYHVNATLFSIQAWSRYTASSPTGQVTTSAVNKTKGTEYWYRLSRDTATQMTITLFTDEAGGTVASGFPQSQTIASTAGSSVSGTALDTVQTSNFNSGDLRTQSWNGTDIKVYNDVSP